MVKQTMENFAAGRYADTALAASRQVWLAGLGAAMVTRDWARNDAGHVFRALVREGSTVESRAIRVIGKQINVSIAVAANALGKARDTALTTVSGIVDTAVAALPRFKAPVAKAAASAKPKRAKHVARKSRRGKRSVTKA